MDVVRFRLSSRTINSLIDNFPRHISLHDQWLQSSEKNHVLHSRVWHTRNNTKITARTHKKITDYVLRLWSFSILLLLLCWVKYQIKIADHAELCVLVANTANRLRHATKIVQIKIIFHFDRFSFIFHSFRIDPNTRT